jgi:hypothetical protein
MEKYPIRNGFHVLAARPRCSLKLVVMKFVPSVDGKMTQYKEKIEHMRGVPMLLVWKKLVGVGAKEVFKRELR